MNGDAAGGDQTITDPTAIMGTGMIGHITATMAPVITAAMVMATVMVAGAVVGTDTEQ